MKDNCSNCYCKYIDEKRHCAWSSKEPVNQICEEFVPMCSCDEEALYKYEGEYYCTECLLDKFDVEEYTKTIYCKNGRYLGDDDSMSEVIENLDEDIEELD